MNKAALIALLAAALAVGGCGQSAATSEGKGDPPERATQSTPPQAQEEQYSADGPALSASDQQGLDESECALAKATEGMTPEEANAYTEELADEIIASEEVVSIADVLAERGITC